MNVYLIIGNANTGKTTVVKRISGIPGKFKNPEEHKLNDFRFSITTVSGEKKSVLLQTYDSLQELYITPEEFYELISKKKTPPQNILVCLRKKGTTIKKHKLPNAITYLEYFRNKGWNIEKVAFMSSEEGKCFPYEQSKTIVNDRKTPVDELAKLVKKHFGWSV